MHAFRKEVRRSPSDDDVDLEVDVETGDVLAWLLTEKATGRLSLSQGYAAAVDMYIGSKGRRTGAMGDGRGWSGSGPYASRSSLSRRRWPSLEQLGKRRFRLALRSRLKMAAALATALLFALVFLLNSITAAPPPRSVRITVNHEGPLRPGIDGNFPDPSFIRANESTWVAFATNGRGRHVQVATATDPLGEWTVLPRDAMPGKGWTTGRDFWAPDVRRLDDGTFIMYFSGRDASNRVHCVGAARSDDVLGPYTMDPAPFVCPREHGGAIDPAGFKDPRTGRRFVVYKVDGNALGPDAGTPIKLQEVGSDGTSLVGDAVTIMERTDEDGALVEAPSLVRLADGMYVLFFSSHMFNNARYDIKYAYAQDIWGPYVRGSSSGGGGDGDGDGTLVRTPDFGLRGPGGMTSSDEGDMLVFHGWCGGRRRCMYSVAYDVHGDWW